MPIDISNPMPLYKQVVENLREKILSGKLKSGDLIGSQQDLANEFGVSLITARKAMAILINEGYLVGRVGKGMYVAHPIRAVDFKRYKTVGLVLSDLRNPFFSLIVHSVEASALDHGYNLLLSNSSGRIEKEERQIQHYLEMGVEGLIIASITHQYQGSPIIKKLKKDRFPFVMVSYIDDPEINYVGVNHEYGGYLATEHLIRLGYQRIGYLSAEKGNLIALLRQHGFERAHREHSKPFRVEDIHYMKWNNFEAGYEIADQVLADISRPQAFFIYSDLAALGFQKAVLDRGLQIPRDVALVGFDNIERAAYAAVPLTTVHQPTYEIGDWAIKNLIHIINGHRDPIRTILEPKLIVRSSCGATASS